MKYSVPGSRTMTRDAIVKVLQCIEYKDWRFHLLEEHGVMFLQVRVTTKCACRPNVGMLEHFCRKWRLSPRITKSEIVQTAFKAILTAEEHETRETFRYKGAAIFGPHFNVEELVNLYERKAWDMRLNSVPVGTSAMGSDPAPGHCTRED